NTTYEKNAGIAISITAPALSLLAAIASPVGQGLIDAYGWQTARAIMSLFTTVLSVVLTVLFVRKSPAVLGLLPVGAEHKPGESAVEKEEELTYES
ncbi:MFS transporter, partial [Adlercreutzia equolifaciens]|nr:MFS transporter [Adlercreutzia equolifaciens]